MGFRFRPLPGCTHERWKDGFNFDSSSILRNFKSGTILDGFLGQIWCCLQFEEPQQLAFCFVLFDGSVNLEAEGYNWGSFHPILHWFQRRSCRATSYLIAHNLRFFEVWHVLMSLSIFCLHWECEKIPAIRVEYWDFTLRKFFTLQILALIWLSTILRHCDILVSTKPLKKNLAVFQLGQNFWHFTVFQW